MKQNFVVTFKEIKENGQPKKLPIYAPDHARATEWALVQLTKWGMKSSPFEVSELVAPPVAPMPPAPKSETKKKPTKRKADPK